MVLILSHTSNSWLLKITLDHGFPPLSHLEQNIQFWHSYEHFPFYALCLFDQTTTMQQVQLYILYYLLKPIVETQELNLYKYIHIYTLHKTFRVIIFFFVSAFILWISMLYFCFFNNKNIRPLIRINWERRNIERLPHHLVKSHVI